MVDLFRWHGSEEVEHRNVAHDVAVYFHDSYVDRIRAMMMAVVAIFVLFQRASWYLVKTDPTTDMVGGSSIGCGCATRSSDFCPNTAGCSAPTPRCTSGPDTHRRRWVRRRKRSPTSPVPPRPARRTFDGTARPFPPGAAQRLRPGAPRSCRWALADAAIAGLLAISGAIRKIKPPAETGPHHRVDGGRPAGGGARPGCGRADAGRRRRQSPAALASRCTPRHPSAERPAPPVLAVR